MNLILASASKARSQLLQNLNISHEIIKSSIDEVILTELDVKNNSLRLAELKANSVAKKINLSSNKNNTLVLGCDSIFEFQNQAFGKPLSKEEAIMRWSKMSGKSGYLHTGHCLLFNSSTLKLNNTNEENFHLISEIITTKIYFAVLSDLEIRRYVSTKEPFQCAGGFALEGKASLFIERIEGCFSNVIGLSLPWLRAVNKKLGIDLTEAKKRA